jgi:hypothetical protein
MPSEASEAKSSVAPPPICTAPGLTVDDPQLVDS